MWVSITENCDGLSKKESCCPLIAAMEGDAEMNLCPVLENQVRVQAEAIALWKRVGFGLIVFGLTIVAVAAFRMLRQGGPTGNEIISIGGLSISLLSAFPITQMQARKERLETFTFYLQQFKSFDQLCAADQESILSLANEAIKDTAKRC
jgi:hypothetical protein